MFLSFHILDKQLAGGHPHFENDHNVSRIKGNPTLNKMTPGWRKSIKTILKLSHLLYISILPFYGLEMRNGTNQM
jgi:hypothetical protein